MAVLALALARLLGALTDMHGNGSSRRSAAGWPSAARRAARPRGELMFLEQASGLASLLVWLAFGAIALPLVPDKGRTSLTLPTPYSASRRADDPGGARAVSAPGWIGGPWCSWAGSGRAVLASLVFALLAVEELG